MHWVAKGIYDDLIKQDILGYLASADLNFDYFIATDVFVYVGDLSDVFHLIKSRNKNSGKLVFSTEHFDSADFFARTIWALLAFKNIHREFV